MNAPSRRSLPTLASEHSEHSEHSEGNEASPRATRRAFAQLFAVASASLLSACLVRLTPVPEGGAPRDASDDGATDASADGGPHPTGLPSLGGAPDNRDGQCIACLCDTVIPGAFRDPTGRPGAIDADVPALFFDRALPAASLVGLIRAVLDGVAFEVAQRSFARLTFAQREDAVSRALESVPEAEFAVQLVRLGFFASDVGARSLGYPGANPGYFADPDFTFGSAPLARELTASDDGHFR
jgi:hypothetical protein